MDIIPVILAGGIGERFWPLSRSSVPKQMLPIISKRTMLEETLRRATRFCSAETVPMIITGKAIGSKVKKALPPSVKYSLIVEPTGKNTAPAIAMAAAKIASKNPDAIMLVLSADHAISPVEAFVKAARFAAKIADERNNLVVFGIRPSRPETQYGYIQQGPSIASSGTMNCFKVNRFIEKPSQASAFKYMKSGTCLWNSGMFVWKVSVILEEFKKHMPKLYRLAMQCSRNGCTKKAITAFYERAEKESIDYGIMEQSNRTAVVAGTFAWDDVGSWEAMTRLHEANSNGTVVIGKGIDVSDSSDSILINKSRKTLAAWGVDNLVIVATDDAVLAIPRSKLNNLKAYLKAAKESGHFPSDLF